MTNIKITDCKIVCISQNDLNSIDRIEKMCYEYPWTKDNILSEINNLNGFNRTIQNANSTILGYFFSYIITNEMYITNFCIDPRYQNKKIGSTLLSNILSEALTVGIKIIFLEVRENNFPAIKLYKRFGFIEDGRRKNFYSDGGTAINMHFKFL